MIVKIQSGKSEMELGIISATTSKAALAGFDCVTGVGVGFKILSKNTLIGL